MLLGKTNDLLVRLGASVKRQKDDDLADTNLDNGVKTSDLLEGQRQYNSLVHSIQEKVLIHLIDCNILKWYILQ